MRAGGGVNHRGSLSDFVLVKDNHLAGLIDHPGGALGPGDGGRPAPIEVECDRLEQVTEAIDAGATLVLLDNMTPRKCASAWPWPTAAR